MITLVLVSIFAGFALMYFLDTRTGRRRRAAARDRLVRLAHALGDFTEVTRRDAANRLHGLLAGKVHDGAVSDEVLEARLRARLGRIVRHPRSIGVHVMSGRVTLEGPILEDEVRRTVSRLAAIPGVREIENRLEVYAKAGDLPQLQGGVPRPGERMEFFQTTWSPTARVLAGLAGAGLLLAGTFLLLPWVGWGGLWGALLGLAGIALLARAVTNLELKRLIGLGAGRAAIDLQKTVLIAAPVERVFRLWTAYENFPRFMSNVREARPTARHQSHWIVTGPGGIPVEWDALITQLIENREVAWKTLPGSLVQHAGRVRFTPERGGTRVDIRLSYNPALGGIGHIFASLFGADPKREMDEDLARMKTFLETGVAPADAAKREHEFNSAHP
ncbi:MAG: SRPBCC family protein [Candidatus Omnitrophica bacterium]|nr:SRPBCC family protein [Candidatus Omnitrophota bacterium]